MSDPNTEVSDPTGGQELPTPSFSESGASPTSTDADALVSKLIAQLEPIIERKVQSQKDKRFSEMEKVLGGRSKILAELESEGVNISKEVRTQMEIRELREQIAQQTSRPAQERVDGSTSQRTATTEAIAALKDNGLTTDDPAVIDIFRGKYGSRAEFDLAVQKYINQKLRPLKPANPADMVQSPATSQSSSSNTSQLIAELNEWQKTPSRYREQIKQRVAELDKAGWK